MRTAEQAHQPVKRTGYFKQNEERVAAMWKRMEDYCGVCAGIIAGGIQGN